MSYDFLDEKATDSLTHENALYFYLVLVAVGDPGNPQRQWKRAWHLSAAIGELAKSFLDFASYGCLGQGLTFTEEQLAKLPALGIEVHVC